MMQLHQIARPTPAGTDTDTDPLSSHLRARVLLRVVDEEVRKTWYNNNSSALALVACTSKHVV